MTEGSETAVIAFLTDQVADYRAWFHEIHWQLEAMLAGEGADPCPLAVQRAAARLVNAHTEHMRATTTRSDWTWIHDLSPRQFADAAIDSPAFRPAYAEELAACKACHR